MRLRGLLASLLLLVVSAPSSGAADIPKNPNAPPPSHIKLELNTDNAGPHEMEDLTKLAITRAYAESWDTLAQALERNDAALLDRNFIGFARDDFAQRIAGQKKAGTRTRLVDLGHNARAIFYSPDGMGIQLRDEAQLEVQILDGDTLVSSTKVTRHYVVLLTPTEVRWKVRILQDVPE